METTERMGTVLFVDDEKNILQSIRREFQKTDFDMLFAKSGSEGMQILSENKVDIVVSDYKMPEMNGIEFLTKVKEKYPDITRVFLSGYIDREAVLEALSRGIATTYFAKPWDGPIIANALKHVLTIRKLLYNKPLLDLLGDIDNLPTIPKLYRELMEAVEKEVSFADMADIVNQDTSISAKILHTANSAFFGSEKTASIEQAIFRLGVNCIKDIVLTISLAKQANLPPHHMQYFENMIKHSALVNEYMQVFYSKIYGKSIDKNLTSIGITHDIGKIVLMQYFPKRFERILRCKKVNPSLTFYECEIYLGLAKMTHAEIGAYLLDFWNLHPISVETALLHHTIDTSQITRNKELIDCIVFVDLMVNHFYDGAKSPDDLELFLEFGYDKVAVRTMAVQIAQNVH